MYKIKGYFIQYLHKCRYGCCDASLPIIIDMDRTLHDEVARMCAMPAIQLRSISHRYATTWAVVGADLCVERGETFALLGHNGCGKSTLLKILATRLCPTSGEGTILGHDLREGAENIRKTVCWLGHDMGLYKVLSGAENLRLAYRLGGRKPCDKTIREVMERLGVGHTGHTPVGAFSSGMRKRLALARLFLEEPAIVLLDEPHANLDRQGRALVGDCITQWKRKGVTVVMASHEHSEIIPLCDRVIVIQQGAIKYCGAPDSIPGGMH